MVDWFEAEEPLHLALYDVVDRLRRRALQRWWLVAILTVVLTGAVVRKVALKPTIYRARVILAITEGDLNAGFNPTPLDQLRDYVANVLLSSDRLLRFLDEHELMRRERARFGDAAAVEEFRDGLQIGVWRNYFQYAWAYDERRSARVAIAYSAVDPAFAYEMARALARAVQDGEADRRYQAAQALAAQARDGVAAARARLDAVAREQAAVYDELAAAQREGQVDRIGALRVRASTLATEWQAATQAFEAVEGRTDFDTLQAEVNAAGLALEIEIVDERRPPVDHGGRLPTLILTAVVALLIIGPLSILVVGAFDTKVHDADDIRRMALPLVGHVPGFPGDDVGSLRQRGVGARRVPSYRRWL
ncbi:MAG: hypothetical protein IPL61_33140 [Myxococcales bacterium]|nr:hypothetical protein [Myxococcales bacterium]